MAADTMPNLGFLTVLAENGSYLGGYLVTNAWGRPLEFRLSTVVQPNRVQNILFGTTLKPYLYADVIGRALVEKSLQAVSAVITDCEPVLDLRLSWETPITWLAESTNELAASLEQGGAGVQSTEHGTLVCHPRFTCDAEPIRGVLRQIGDALDLAEPFSRIREALLEARKMGVTARGA
jgi:hypothetical protein